MCNIASLMQTLALTDVCLLQLKLFAGHMSFGSTSIVQLTFSHIDNTLVKLLEYKV